MQYKKIILKNEPSNENLLERLLKYRGLTCKNEIERFLNPTRNDFLSPYDFQDMEKAVNRINFAIKNNEKILIWGDFDCDGVTSTAILYKTFKRLNANAIKYIPDRLTDGHGLNTKKLIQLYSKEKFTLVITVDCGISDVSEIQLLNSFKIDTIITDHHSTDRELPKAYAVINPQVKGAIKDNVKVKDIISMTYNCGAIVAYKLATALLETIDDEKLKDELLVIAACGAIADVVPLLGENRAIVCQMLNLLNTKKENSSKPIYKLLSDNVHDRNITAGDIAFILAPRINAVGRLANAELSFEFLNTDNDFSLDIIIKKLNNYNAIRQAKCAEVYDDIKEYLNKNKNELLNPAIVLINKDWHVGIIGIVAAKIVEEYGKPCFLMTIDENNNARCSIRSNENINVYEVLAQNEDLFSGFGGHKLAGGCSFDLDKTDFEEVKKSLLLTIRNNSAEKPEDNVLKADIELDIDEINTETIQILDKLEPYGEGNPMPVCAMFDVELKEVKIIGKNNNHLRLTFLKNNKILNCVKWQESSIMIPTNSKCDIAFYPKINSFNGEIGMQLEIIDVYSPDITKQINEKPYKIYDHRQKTDISDTVDEYIKKTCLDIRLYVKNPKTKEILSKFENLKNNFLSDNFQHDVLMFFDYPASIEEFIDLMGKIKPKKIHLMCNTVDENIENYIKQLNGMAKYCSSKLNGILDIEKMSVALGVNIEFVQIALEILENLNAIKFNDSGNLEYLHSFTFEDFKNSAMFVLLEEEFDKIIEFKNELLNCDTAKIEEIIESCSY